MKIALLLGYFATWAFIPQLLLLKKRPTATLAWLWAILFIPFIGAAAYFAIGTDRLKRRRLRRRNLFSARASLQLPPDGTTDAGSARRLAELPRRDRQFLQVLSRINQLPLSSAAGFASSATPANSIRRSRPAFAPPAIMSTWSSISGTTMTRARVSSVC
jgi:hypothetical protein